MYLILSYSGLIPILSDLNDLFYTFFIGLPKVFSTRPVFLTYLSFITIIFFSIIYSYYEYNNKLMLEIFAGVQFFFNYLLLVWMILISLQIVQLDTFLNMTILFFIPFIVLFSGEFLTSLAKSKLNISNKTYIQVVLVIVIAISILSIILFESIVISLLQQQESANIFLKRVYFLLIFGFLLFVLQFLYSVDIKELKTRQNTYGIEVKLFFMNVLFISSIFLFQFSLFSLL